MRTLAGAIGLGLLAASSQAATLCVAPSGTGGCHASIQAAVTAAAAGDLVQVRPGVYYENVTVPIGKDGLQIMGVSKLTTILDPDDPNVAAGVTVVSRRVSVRNLTVRNGQNSGIVVLANDSVIQGVRVLGIRGGLAGLGFAAGTTGHQVLDNEVRSVSGRGIYLAGSNSGSIVRNNLVMHTGGYGVEALGNDIDVVFNKIINATNGISVTGNGAAVSNNLVERTGVGLAVSGNLMTVSANRLVATAWSTIECTTCTGGLVQANIVERGYWVRFNANDPGLVVQANKVAGMTSAAFETVAGSNGIRFSRNAASDVGNGHCFAIAGSGHTLDYNTASRCAASGFGINGDAITLDHNTATGAGVSGFEVDGDSGGGLYANATLTGNTATGNDGQGFAVINAAVNTVLTGNKATSHRIDFCDQGTVTNTTGGNTFGSTSLVCDILE